MGRGGRAGEFAAVDLSDALRDLGLTLGRLKTGTSPRLRRSTIDFASLPAQWGDAEPWPFHWATDRLPLPQMACHLTYTTPGSYTVKLTVGGQTYSLKLMVKPDPRGSIAAIIQDRNRRQTKVARSAARKR